MALTLRWLEEGETALGMEYVAKLWSPDHILARDPDLFDWQYSWPDSGGRKGFLIAEDEGRPVGCIGRMQMSSHIYGQPLSGAAMALFVVDPAYRGRAVGIDLLKAAYADLDIILTLGINSRVARLYKMMGQHIVEETPRIVCRGNMDAIKAMWQLAGNGAFPESEYASLSRFIPETRTGGTVERLDRNGLDEWDEFWKSAIEPRSLGAKRDARYIAWRYLQHPTFNYDLALAKRKGRICGLTVTRLIPLSEDANALRIVDFIAEDEEAAGILRKAISERVDAHTAFVENVSFGEMSAFLRPLGLDKNAARLFSVYFNPPDLNVCSIKSAFFSKVPSVAAQAFLDSEDCYFSIADGDQDRPN